ncbi:hypothetical protein CEW46_29255 [Bacillus cereus]|nr:hypothetical protein CEW46_29255 [Bacillus cereus]
MNLVGTSKEVKAFDKAYEEAERLSYGDTKLNLSMDKFSPDLSNISHSRSSLYLLLESIYKEADESEAIIRRIELRKFINKWLVCLDDSTERRYFRKLISFL